MNINDLLKKIEGFSASERLKVKEAFEVASRAHSGMKRGTGEPYIIHPLSVAVTVAELGLDCDAITAALLHDIAEDTDYSLEDIEKKFGKTVASLVDGVTKLGQVRFPKDVSEESFDEPHELARLETYRKMFLATAKDMRVILIKLADRLHNMQTLEGVIPRKRYRIAKETLELYAPIASRLGIGQIKGKLEDLAFPYVYPEEYQRIKNLVQTHFKEREKLIESAKKILAANLKEEKIEAEIHGRAKHLYSLFKKLKKYNNDFSQIYDLIALRVVVSDISDCYRVLGIVHKLWKPLMGRIKDYIAQPKPNGYQSLHTTVFGPDGKIFEIQIRTKKMHDEAEFGVAAHWQYAEEKHLFGLFKRPKQIVQSRTKWVHDLARWQKFQLDPQEFAQSLKIDFFSDRIFVFSPKGDVYDLPEGATPVDFAYEVHSVLGDYCVGAKVNQQIVPLDYKLKSGEIVEILVGKKPNVSRGWLNFVQSNKAKTHIRSWLRKQAFPQLVKIGKETINKELQRLLQSDWDTLIEKNPQFRQILLDSYRLKNLEEILAGLAEGKISAIQILHRLGLEKKILGRSRKRHLAANHASNLSGILSGVPHSLASCCKPLEGDQIVGYVSTGEKITIHKSNCKMLKKLDSSRFVKLSWQKAENVYLHRVPITIFAEDRIGLLHDITGVLAKNRVNIFGIKQSKPDSLGKIKIQMITEIDSLENLDRILADLPKINGVVSALRKSA
jgi:GTP pyrophosphokinase